MACRFTNNIPPEWTYSIGGVRRVFIARKRHAIKFFYSNDDLNLITDIQTGEGDPTAWFEFHVQRGVVNPSETMDKTLIGTHFPQAILLEFPVMTASKRDVLEALIYDRTVLVYEDMLGRFWLLGQDAGLTSKSFKGESGTKGQTNRYRITLGSIERFQVREVQTSAFIPNVAPNGGSGPIGNPSPAGPGGSPTNAVPPVLNVGGSGPGGTLTSALSSWISPSGTPVPLYTLGNYSLIQFIQ